MHLNIETQYGVKGVTTAIKKLQDVNGNHTINVTFPNNSIFQTKKDYSNLLISFLNEFKLLAATDPRLLNHISLTFNFVNDDIGLIALNSEYFNLIIDTLSLYLYPNSGLTVDNINFDSFSLRGMNVSNHNMTRALCNVENLSFESCEFSTLNFIDADYNLSIIDSLMDSLKIIGATGKLRIENSKIIDIAIDNKLQTQDNFFIDAQLIHLTIYNVLKIITSKNSSGQINLSGSRIKRVLIEDENKLGSLAIKLDDTICQEGNITLNRSQFKLDHSTLTDFKFKHVNNEATHSVTNGISINESKLTNCDLANVSILQVTGKSIFKKVTAGIDNLYKIAPKFKLPISKLNDQSSISCAFLTMANKKELQEVARSYTKSNNLTTAIKKLCGRGVLIENNKITAEYIIIYMPILPGSRKAPCLLNLEKNSAEILTDELLQRLSASNKRPLSLLFKEGNRGSEKREPKKMKLSNHSNDSEYEDNKRNLANK